MDYVYICRKGENEELRYSIRSVVNNLPEGKIWVVGYKPSWYSGNFISVKDRDNKFNNIKNCLHVIASSPEISKNFVSMHDDFFVIEPTKQIPVLHGGSLLDRVAEYRALAPGSRYTRLLESTYNRLLHLGIKDPIDYDIHVPMIFNKEKVLKILNIPFLERSIYGNLNGIGGERSTDVKAYSFGKMSDRSYDPFTGQSPFLSTEDTSFDRYKNMLNDMFPKPSFCENQTAC
jgi:hypothetical protein